MKIEVIWAQSPKSGISRATSVYGDDAVLLSNKKIGQRYRLMIGVSETKSNSSAGQTPQLVNSVKPTQVRERIDYQAISQMIKDEIKSLRKEMVSMAEKTSANNSRSLEFLKQAGIPVNLQGLLISKAEENMPPQKLINAAKRKLFQNLPESTDLNRAVKVHTLCGNYGSGKTTVAVKIALKFMSLCKVPPILVSYKQAPSASSALMKELSESFNLPIFDVPDIKTLRMIEEQLVGDSILIVDTSTSNVLENIPEMENTLESVNFHLVNASDSFSASQEYLINAAKWSSIIITRLEMKSSRWPLIESLVNTQVPLSLGSVSPDLNSELVCVSKKDLVNQLDQEFRKALVSTVPEASSNRAAA